MRKALAALAILFLAAHLPSLPPSLEDLDSVNFALGVRDFDVAAHQPHPPGNPVYVALAKISTAALRAGGIPSPEPRGLAIWSAIAGAVMVWLAAAFFQALDGDRRRAMLTAVLLAATPVFWFTALRPLSDMAGLAAAFTALTPLAMALRPGEWAVRQPRLLIAGAFLAGLAIGVRSQTAVLTLPFLAFALVRAAGATRAARLQAIAAWFGGVMTWAIPQLIESGGPAAYLAALGSQGAEDFSGVMMLWTQPTARVAAYALLHTFILPWRLPILAGAVLLLAAAGFLVLLRRSPRVPGLLVLVFGPYALFHLLFQETVTVRYAMPLLPAIAYLAVTALSAVHWLAGTTGVAVLAAAGLALSVPAGVAYGREPAPVFRMFSDMRAQPPPAAVGMHRRVFTETRRARLWEQWIPADLLPPRRDYEWLELIRALQSVRDQPVWFIADPRRTDLALTDSHGSHVRSYRWPFDAAVFVGGARPNEMEWRTYSRPGWLLGQGWALTPEVAGIAHREGWGPHVRPSIGWIRRRAEEARLLIGGRHLGGAGDPPAIITMDIEGRELLRLEVPPGFFFHTASIPAGVLQGPGTFAELSVTATSAVPGAVAPPVALEQFDLQPPGTPMFGFAEGWHEPESNPATGRTWRWLSDRSRLWIHPGDGDVNVCLNGESPEKYYDADLVLRVTASEEEIARLDPDDDFEACAKVSQGTLAAADGRVIIESNLTHVPAERDGVADRRRLALRIYSVRIVPAPLP